MPAWNVSLPPELLAQFVLGSHQHPPARSGQVLAGAVDVKRQHRQCRTEWVGLSSLAGFGGTFQRCRDPPGIFRGEDAGAEIQGVAAFGHFMGPPPARAFCHEILPSAMCCTLKTNPFPRCSKPRADLGPNPAKLPRNCPPELRA